MHINHQIDKYNAKGANNQISTLTIKYNPAMATMNASTTPMITLCKKKNKTDDSFTLAI